MARLNKALPPTASVPCGLPAPLVVTVAGFEEVTLDAANAAEEAAEADAEAERVKQERLKAYAEKKAAKPKTIAKSIVTLDVSPLPLTIFVPVASFSVSFLGGG